jgi:hypothetical protein
MFQNLPLSTHTHMHIHTQCHLGCVYGLWLTLNSILLSLNCVEPSGRLLDRMGAAQNTIGERARYSCWHCPGKSLSSLDFRPGAIWLDVVRCLCVVRDVISHRSVPQNPCTNILIRDCSNPTDANTLCSNCVDQMFVVCYAQIQNILIACMNYSTESN